MNKKINAFTGAKFYKYKENGDLEIIRIVRVKSNTSYVIIKENDPRELKHIKTADQLHEYTLLKSDALYTFNIVLNAEDSVKLQDVIVTMSRKTDKAEPYVICRQMMNNMFMGMVTNEVHLGCSISQDTCPADVKFRGVTICNKLLKTITINGYLTDTPDTILKLADKIIMQGNKILSDQYKILSSNYKGLSKSVKELLEDNGFWQDVNKGLKVYELNDNIENCSLNLEQLTYLEQEISYLMDKVHVIEYGHDVDFTQIKSDYMLIRDDTNKLYLVSYLRGSFIKQEHLNEEELAKFNSVKI